MVILHAVSNQKISFACRLNIVILITMGCLMLLVEGGGGKEFVIFIKT